MQSHATETNQNTMILFLFSIFNMKKSFSIVSPPTFHLAPRSLTCLVKLRVLQFVYFFKKQEKTLFAAFASSSRIWPNAYAANKFNLSANGFLKSFGKDKAYTLTTKKVNNPAFVYCDILGGGGGGGGDNLSRYIFLY